MKLEEAIAKAKILNDSLKELTDEYEGQGSFIAACLMEWSARMA